MGRICKKVRFLTLRFLSTISAEQCIPYREEICQQYGYDHLAVPGYAGLRHPAQASSLLTIIAGVNHATHCYKHSVLFGCAALFPNCSENGRGVISKTPPCRSLCESKFLNRV